MSEVGMLRQLTGYSSDGVRINGPARLTGNIPPVVIKQCETLSFPQAHHHLNKESRRAADMGI